MEKKTGAALSSTSAGKSVQEQERVRRARITTGSHRAKNPGIVNPNRFDATAPSDVQSSVADEVEAPS